MKRAAALALTATLLAAGAPRAVAGTRAQPRAAAAREAAAGVQENAGGCGDALSPEDVAHALERETGGASARGAFEGPALVRTAIHIVRTSAGLGGLDSERLANALHQANEDFAPLSIGFVVEGPIDTIDSDAFFYQIDTLAEINQLRSTNVVPHAMNVYFTENLASELGAFCGVSSFSWREYQGIVMDNACVPSLRHPSTFTHEIGHYLDLYHTHETALGAECADGSNCATAGDRLCDTSADPNLQSCGESGHDYCVDRFCAYTAAFTDPCHGDPYTPPAANFMSYSRPECRIEFSPSQRAKAYATLTDLRPDHIVPATGLPPDGATGSSRRRGIVAMLGAPSPNPARDAIVCRVALPAAGRASVRLHDASGRVVQTLFEGALAAGAREFVWRLDGRLSSGIYFLRLQSRGEAASRTVVVAR